FINFSTELIAILGPPYAYAWLIFSTESLPTISALVSLGILTITVFFLSGFIDNKTIESERSPPPSADLVESESIPNTALEIGSPLVSTAFFLSSDLSLYSGLCIVLPNAKNLYTK